LELGSQNNTARKEGQESEDGDKSETCADLLRFLVGDSNWKKAAGGGRIGKGEINGGGGWKKEVGRKKKVWEGCQGE